jgi:hypothetical protein
LYRFPLPHEHGSFLPKLIVANSSGAHHLIVSSTLAMQPLVVAARSCCVDATGVGRLGITALLAADL